MNATQPVDAVDITSLIRGGAEANAVGIESYHAGKYNAASGYGGRILARVVVTYTDNTTTTVNTNAKPDGGWQVFNGAEAFNPTGQ